jgi:hypothetical protein
MTPRPVLKRLIALEWRLLKVVVIRGIPSIVLWVMVWLLLR